MADLPDINTGSVSFLAYWNAIDQGGAADLAPDEILTASGVQTHTLYDNGVECVYQVSHGREINVRAKTDGWIVAYIDNTASFDSGTDVDSMDSVRGPWDISNRWDTRNDQDIIQNELERAINACQAELSNVGQITYNASDVGLYNYEHPTSTNVTLLSMGVRGGNETGTLLWTSGTTRNEHYVFGFYQCGTNDNGGNINAFADFDGFSFGSQSVEGAIAWYAEDCLVQNLASSADTEYSGNIRGGTGYNSNYYESANQGHMVVWE